MDLVPGLVLAWSVPLDLSSLTVDVLGHGIVLWSTALSPSHAAERWTGNQDLFKEDLEISVDFNLGEITVSGSVCYRVGDDWQCVQFPQTVLVAWSPTLGTVGGQLEAHPPQINSATFGSSNSIIPTITRIPVDTVDRIGTPVGKMVKQTLFPTTADFTFNGCFSVGPFKPNAAFMAEQMAACRQVITNHYAALGFPLTAPGG